MNLGTAIHRRRLRALSSALVVALIASVAAIAGLAPTSGADIATPQANAVVRDAAVTITESPGGTTNNLCSGASTVIEVKRADSTIAHAATKSGTGAFSTTWNTAAEQPGFFTITSTVTNRTRPHIFTSCQTNVVTDQITVEYRPWNYTFRDLLGHGSFGINSSPPEFQYTIDGNVSPVIQANGNLLQFFSSSTGLGMLVEDPLECIDDLESCLPEDAIVCDVQAGCERPRIAVIDHHAGGDHIFGIFDLNTRAFIAVANAGGKARVLVSAGTDFDALVSDLLVEIVATGQEVTGADLAALLSTTVEIHTVQENRHEVNEVGILRGYQYSKMAATPDSKFGVDIAAPYSINAGFITHTVAPHTFSQADGDPSVFTVTPSPLVPNLPTLFSVPLGDLGSVDLLLPVPVPEPLNEVAGDVILVGGGPLVNIHGTYPDGTGSHGVGTTSTGPNVDTAQGADSGLPVWLPGADAGSVADSGPIDFLGHAAVFLDLPQICALGACLDLGTILIGQGITVFGDSPLPPLADLPLLWDTDNPAAAELNELTSNLLLETLTNPAVGEVLAAALILLGGDVPDLDGVVEALSDLETITELIDAVSGVAGLDAVPGLEDALNELGVVTELLPLEDSGSGGGASSGNLLTGLLGLLGL